MPWKAEVFKDFIIVRDARGEEVCSIDYLPDADENEAIANARAIAVAPEMLFLLRDLFDDITMLGTSPYVLIKLGTQLIEFGTRLRDILAKVEGE